MIYPQKMWWKKYFQTLLKVTLECISGSVSFIQFFFYFIALGGPSKYTETKPQIFCCYLI